MPNDPEVECLKLKKAGEQSLAKPRADALCDIFSHAVERAEETGNALDIIRGSVSPMTERWFDVVPEYLRGNVEEREMRQYARLWGLFQVGIMRAISLLFPDPPKQHAEAFRKHFQAMWCPTDPTGHVYFILAPHSLAVKIGYTANGCALRLLQLQIGTPEPLLLLGYMPADERYTEMFLHAHFQEQRIRGEWFQFTAAIVEFIRWACDRRAPDVTLEGIPEFTADKWNCDPWPKGLPQSNKEIEAWLAQPELY